MPDTLCCGSPLRSDSSAFIVSGAIIVCAGVWTCCVMGSGFNAAELL